MLRLTVYEELCVQSVSELCVGKTAKSIYVLAELTAMICAYYAQDHSVYE